MEKGLRDEEKKEGRKVQFRDTSRSKSVFLNSYFLMLYFVNTLYCNIFEDVNLELTPALLILLQCLKY